MTSRNTSAAIALAGLLGAPGALAADPACRDASFCPDMQLVRPCQATSCERADMWKAAGLREERIVDQELDGSSTIRVCSRLSSARSFFVNAAADGDPSAMDDRDRVQRKMKDRGCPSDW